MLQKENNFELIAAHLDHGWRNESYKDDEFCRKAAVDFGVEYCSAKITDLSLSLKFNGSQEEIGRKMRRHFFETVKKEQAADLIALGHHADDQQETFFIRLMRGAGLEGLTGMKPQHGAYIRPLLSMHKKEILHYLDGQGIPYLIDPTNDSQDYLRNKIRSTIIPALENADSRFEHNFFRTIKNLTDTHDFLEQHTLALWAKIARQDPLEITLEPFLAVHPVMRHRLLLFWLIKEKVPFCPREAFFNEIHRFLSMNSPGEHQVQKGWKIVKKSGHARIEKTV